MSSRRNESRCNHGHSSKTNLTYSGLIFGSIVVHKALASLSRCRIHGNDPVNDLVFALQVWEDRPLRVGSAPMVGNVEKQDRRVGHVGEKDGERHRDSQEGELVAAPAPHVAEDVFEIIDELLLDRYTRSGSEKTTITRLFAYVGVDSEKKFFVLMVRNFNLSLESISAR